MTRKTAFPLTIAIAKRNNEVWAFSSDYELGPIKEYNNQSLALVSCHELEGGQTIDYS